MIELFALFLVVGFLLVLCWAIDRAHRRWAWIDAAIEAREAVDGREARIDR